jgi:hypothetical protein
MQVAEKERMGVQIVCRCDPPAELLNDDEGIVLPLSHAAVVAFEIPAAGSHFTCRDSPRGVTFGQEPRPGTARTAKSLYEAQRAKNRNHPAFLNLDERKHGHLPKRA